MNLAPHWGHTCGFVSSNDELRRFRAFGDDAPSTNCCGDPLGSLAAEEEGLPPATAIFGLRAASDGPNVLFELEAAHWAELGVEGVDGVNTILSKGLELKDLVK